MCIETFLWSKVIHGEFAGLLKATKKPRSVERGFLVVIGSNRLRATTAKRKPCHAEKHQKPARRLWRRIPTCAIGSIRSCGSRKDACSRSYRSIQKWRRILPSTADCSGCGIRYKDVSLIIKEGRQMFTAPPLAEPSIDPIAMPES